MVLLLVVVWPLCLYDEWQPSLSNSIHQLLIVGRGGGQRGGRGGQRGGSGFGGRGGQRGGRGGAPRGMYHTHNLDQSFHSNSFPSHNTTTGRGGFSAKPSGQKITFD